MRQTLQSLFGYDLPTAQKWVIAFGVILVLLVLLGLFARQIKDGRLRIKGQSGGRTRQPRLGVVDIYDLDRQRQLVLIRRDNVEHLVMIGGVSDVVVETNIVRSGARAAVPTQADPGMPERPLPFDTLVPPEPLRPEPAEEPRRAAPSAPVALAPTHVEPLPPLPSSQPLPPPRSAPRSTPTLTQAEAAVAAAAVGGAAAIAGAALSQAQTPPAPVAPAAPLPMGPAPSFARGHAPAPAVSAGELDDMARQLDEALKRPFSAVRPAGPAAHAATEAEVAIPASEPALATEPEPAPAIVVPSVAAVVKAATPAPARIVPLDVEAELEMALGLKPERTSPKPPLFAPKPPEPAPVAEPEPVRAPEPVHEPVAVALPPEPVAEPEPDEPEAEVEAEVETVPEAAEAETEAEELEPVAAEHHAEVATETHAPAEAAVEKAPEPEPEPEPKAVDPFSVDAIEAEFARLLGRDPKSRS